MNQELIDDYKKKQEEAAEKSQLLNAISDASRQVSETVVAAEKHTKNVTVTNDLAKPSDIDKVVQAVKEIDLQPQDLQPIADALTEVSQAIAKLPTEYPEFPSFPEAPEQREDVKVTNLNELKEYFEDVVRAVGALKTSIKFDPKIEVKPADVKITEKTLDLSPITTGLANLEKAFKAVKTPEFDTSKIIQGLDKVSKSVNSLSFPVPNYVLPFKDVNGNAVQVQLDASGNIPTTGGGGGGGGGTQYADGAARGTATGTLVMGDDGTNIQSIAAKSLSTVPVDTDVGLITQSLIVGKTTAGGGSFVDVKVNPSGALATETTIAGTVPLPTGAATATNQLNEIDILNLIQSAVQSVAGAKGVASDLRVTIVSGTVTTVATVTTVSTVSNQTNIGGIAATTLVPSISNSAAVLSNINNIVR